MAFNKGLWAALLLAVLWVVLLLCATDTPEFSKPSLSLAPLHTSQLVSFPPHTLGNVVERQPTTPDSQNRLKDQRKALEEELKSANIARGKAKILSQRISVLEQLLAACQKRSANVVSTRTPNKPVVPYTHAVSSLAPIPVVIFTYNRADRLQRCLDILISKTPWDHFHLFVSQDGDAFPDVTEVINTFVEKNRGKLSVTHIIHKRDDSGATPEELEQGWQPYYAISHHYHSTINAVFKQDSSFQRIILLEDDIEIADDFFALMLGTAPLFDVEPKLYCVSGFNDNGVPELVSDPNQLFRSDFFPGLGWMTSRRIWDELSPKWPKGFWDDWMRQPDKRKGRFCIRPEVPRSLTRCSEQGVSGGQFCDHLEKMQLCPASVAWTTRQLQSLVSSTYDSDWKRRVDNAQLLRTVFEVETLPPNVMEAKVMYATNDELIAFEEQLGAMTDFKDGIPRTAYRGVVSVRFKGRMLHLAPRTALYAFD